MLQLQDLPACILFDHIAAQLEAQDVSRFHHVCMTHHELRQYREDSLSSWMRLNPHCTCLYRAVARRSKVLFEIYLRINPKLLFYHDTAIVSHLLHELVFLDPKKEEGESRQLFNMLHFVIRAFVNAERIDALAQKASATLHDIYKMIGDRRLQENQDYHENNLRCLLTYLFDRQGLQDPVPQYSTALDANQDQGRVWKGMVYARKIDHLYFMQSLQQTLDPNVREAICQDISTGAIPNRNIMNVIYWIIDMIPVPPEGTDLNSYIDQVCHVIITCSGAIHDESDFSGIIDLDAGTTVTIAQFPDTDNLHEVAHAIVLMLLDQHMT